MKALIQIMLLLVAMFCGGSNVYSQVLSVGIALALIEDYPKQYEKIKQALMSTGLDFDFRVLPSERSLQMLSRGELAMDLARQPSAVASFKDLIQVNPPTNSLELWLMTHPDNKSLCTANLADLKPHSVVGIRGFRIFKNAVYPYFSNHEEVNRLEQALHMIFDKRADFTLWTVPGLVKAQDRIGQAAWVCGKKPFIKIKLYSYIHKHYAWALPKIEQAYRQHFTNTQP